MSFLKILKNNEVMRMHKKVKETNMKKKSITDSLLFLSQII